MIDQIAPYLPYYPYVIGVWFGVSVLMLLAALYNIQRRKTAAMWRSRHRADKRGRRLLIWSVSNLVAVMMLGLVSGSVILAFGYVEEFFPPRNPYDVTGVAVAVLPTEDPNRTFTPTITPSPTLTPPATRTPAPSGTPTPPASRTPSPTATPAPTDTASPTLAPLARVGITPPVTSRTAPPGATLRVVAVDDDITAGNTPDSPSVTFTTDVETLHFFVTYQNMENGIGWSWVLFRNGIPVEGDATLWSRGEAGAKSFTFAAPDGYPVGEYQVRLYLDQQEVDRYAFTVTPPI